jgi:hypothetical protein
MKITVLLLIGLIALNASRALGQTPRTAEDYNNRGMERQGKGDLDGAIDDDTKALELKPKPREQAIIYNNRKQFKSDDGQSRWKTDWRSYERLEQPNAH